MKEDKPAASSALSRDDPHVFARPRWRHASRVYGALITLLFNITVIGANVDRYHRGKHLNFAQEIVIYLLMLACDLLILFPIIFEVDIAKITDDKLILKTTFWKTAIPWGNIVEFKRPRLLNYGVVRTARCFYLINSRTTPRFDQLARDISSHLDTAESRS